MVDRERRDFLKLLLVAAVLNGIVVGCGITYLFFPRIEIRTETITETITEKYTHTERETVTEPIFHTITRTTTRTVTETQTRTITQTITPKKLDDITDQYIIASIRGSTAVGSLVKAILYSPEEAGMELYIGTKSIKIEIKDPTSIRNIAVLTSAYKACIAMTQQQGKLILAPASINAKVIAFYGNGLEFLITEKGKVTGYIDKNGYYYKEKEIKINKGFLEDLIASNVYGFIKQYVTDRNSIKMELENGHYHQILEVRSRLYLDDIEGFITSVKGSEGKIFVASYSNVKNVGYAITDLESPGHRLLLLDTVSGKYRRILSSDLS